MTPAKKRKLIQWIHMLFAIPVVGYIYGPVADIPQAVFVVRFVIFPTIVLSGLWLWKGYLVKKWVKKLRR